MPKKKRGAFNNFFFVIRSDKSMDANEMCIMQNTVIRSKVNRIFSILSKIESKFGELETLNKIKYHSIKRRKHFFFGQFIHEIR